MLETLVSNWINASKIDEKQFGGIGGVSTTDALVEMIHRLYEGTDHAGNFAPLLLLDYSKAFDLVNHNILISKLLNLGIPSHIGRLLLNCTQCVKVGNALSNEGRHKGCPQGTVTGPKNFFSSY